MRDLIRPEVLRREVIPLGAFAGIVALLYFAALIIGDDLSDAHVALAWTMRAVGALIAIVAAFGLLWRTINDEPLERQLGFVMVLLAGLLLVDVHWSLAVVLGAIGVALIIKAIMLRDYPRAAGSTTGYTSPTVPRTD